MIKPALLRNSPERAFESLYQRHVKDVYRYSLALLDRQADAEDATQTTFMNAYRALERGERPRNPRAWLKAIALNVCRAHYRRAGRRPDEVSLEEDPGDLVLEPSGPEISDLVRGLSCLPFNQRAALVMREFEGLSMKEVAARLNVSDSAVEALLFRARRALREQLEEKLTCAEAERAISRQLDGALARAERGRLRAHLRECRECAGLAKRVRAQRSVMRSLALIPLPASLKLGRLFGGGASSASAATASSSAVPATGSLFASFAGSVAGKVALVAVAGAAAVGAGYQAVPKHPATPARESQTLAVPAPAHEALAATGVHPRHKARQVRPVHAAEARHQQVAPERSSVKPATQQHRPVRTTASKTTPIHHRLRRSGSSSSGSSTHAGGRSAHSTSHGAAAAKPRTLRSAPVHHGSSKSTIHLRGSSAIAHAQLKPRAKKRSARTLLGTAVPLATP